MIILNYILSHLLGDFIFQTNKMANEKAENSKRHLKIHLFLYSVITIIISFLTIVLLSFADNVLLPTIVTTAFIIVSHGLIDCFFKPWLIKNIYSKTVVLVIDQISHIVCILIPLIVFYYTKSYNFIKIDFNNATKLNSLIIYLLVSVIIITKVSGIFISFLFFDITKDIKENVKKDDKKVDDKSKLESLLKFGKYIGYVERLLIFAFTLLGFFQGVIVVVGVKTFARFKQLDDRDFSEKYILGTLISLSIALLAGYIGNIILKL